MITQGIKRKNSRLVWVDPFFVEVADNYRQRVKSEFGFDLPRTNVTKQMADVFHKMLNVNGLPGFKTKTDKIGHVKRKTLFCEWEFDL